MKRFGLLLAAVAIAGGALTTASAWIDATQTMCHRTTSKSKPYVKIRVSGKALTTHVGHAADIIPAPRGACPRTILSASSGGRAFSVALTGEAEQPAGEPAPTATATVRLRTGQGSTATGSPRGICRPPTPRTSTARRPERPARWSSRSSRRTRRATPPAA